jgi:hypothetical protein
MVAGDVVNGQSTGAGVNLTFQPAAGVEVAITSFFGGTSGFYIALSDGTLNSIVNMNDSNTTVGQRNPCNIKCMINNSIYLLVNSNAYPAGFSGIQTK